jgi:hypothetical protein
MGFTKRLMEEAEERGWWSGGEKWVCAAHVEDDALERLIHDNASSTSCSYCERESDEPFAAELDVLIERIATSLPHEWRSADEEGVAWDGGYVGATYDSYDLLTDALGDKPLNDSQLIIDVVNALPEHSWAQRDFYRLEPHERLRYAWDYFSEVVKHKQRYFFSDYHDEYDEGDPDYVAPGDLLAQIGDVIRDAGLLKELGVDALFRVRGHGAEEEPRTAAELGTPPIERIRSASRMSPAGIPMFYGALDEETATLETKSANPEDEAFTLGTFRLRRPALVVDLSTLPDVPSLFDEDRRHLRTGAMFLRYFAQAIAEPFVRDNRIHIEYVPTQVVTEWIRTRFESGRTEPIEGVLYQSARNPDGVNAALFIDNQGSCETGEAATNGSALLVLTDAHPVK